MVASVLGSQTSSPVILGLMHYLERHIPTVGYFKPFAGKPGLGSKFGVDKHVELYVG